MSVEDRESEQAESRVRVGSHKAATPAYERAKKACTGFIFGLLTAAKYYGPCGLCCLLLMHRPITARRIARRHTLTSRSSAKFRSSREARWCPMFTAATVAAAAVVTAGGEEVANTDSSPSSSQSDSSCTRKTSPAPGLQAVEVRPGAERGVFCFVHESQTNRPDAVLYYALCSVS